jgi:hypothetical protein
MIELKDDVREQILRSIHIEQGNIRIIAGEPVEGYMAELKIRAIGNFKDDEEARHHLLIEMTGAINSLFKDEDRKHLDRTDQPE